MSEERGTGQTTRQLSEAPHGAIFVWVNGHLDYPKELAKRLGRDDIRIVSPDRLRDGSLVGTAAIGIILDHACELSEVTMANYRALIQVPEPKAEIRRE